MDKIFRVSVFLIALGFGNGIAPSVHAQSEAELLEMMRAMREQINAQQRQLEAIEEELKRRTETSLTTKGIETPQSGTTATFAPGNDWSIGGFVGGAFMLDTDMTRADSGGFVNRGKNVVFESSPLVGTKGGFCPALFSYFCMELAFDYFKPSVNEQFVKGSIVGPIFSSPGAFIPSLKFGIWSLGLNAVGRIGLIQKPDYPLGQQLHFYAGAGPSFVWTTVKEASPPNAARDGDFAVGVDAVAGIKYFMSKNVAVFGEYKFRHWRSGPFHLGTDQMHPINFNANLFYVGLALHP